MFENCFLKIVCSADRGSVPHIFYNMLVLAFWNSR